MLDKLTLWRDENRTNDFWFTSRPNAWQPNSPTEWSIEYPGTENANVLRIVFVMQLFLQRLFITK